MDKVKIFMTVTALISVICFNFNRALYVVLCWICKNLRDDSIPVYGPYMRVKPISILFAITDKQTCTNKIKLLTNWYWDNDIRGLTLSHLPVDGRIIAINYTKKYSNNPYQVHKCIINTVTEKIVIDEKENDIIFEELKMI